MALWKALFGAGVCFQGVLAGLYATAFSKYPGYSGSLDVSGSVHVGQAGTDVVLWYDLKGADSNCIGAALSEANACGVHIHSGTSCSSDQGGHFYDGSDDGSDDPWASVTYKVLATASGVTLQTNKSIEENEGKAFVVHDATGARIACALLEKSSEKLVATSFGRYPGYEGELNVSGSVEVVADGEDLTLSWDLFGTDTLCTGAANSAANACGAHIHAGTSCESAAGHFFGTAEDPWTTISYTAKASYENYIIASGKTLEDNLGKIFVVHDSSGARFACDVLSADANVEGAECTLETLSVYPGYSGDLTSVAGTAIIHQVGTGADAAQVLSFDLIGADTRCNPSAELEKANACGIHVHSGTSCDDAGGHFYDGDVDPWTSIIYHANAETGAVARSHTVKIPTGKTGEDVTGKTLVVHDFDGARIACGTLKFGKAGLVNAATSATVGSLLVLVFTFQLAQWRC